jgi:hypothetical protein
MPDPRPAGHNRYPGYDVLSKRSGPSWTEQTRRVISRRLAVGAEPRFFTTDEFRTLIAIAARIVPQPTTRPPIPVAALVDEKLARGAFDGYRSAGMPRDGDAWRLGLKALNAESISAYGAAFHDLAEGLQNSLLGHMQRDELEDPEWASMSPKDFFKKRMAHDMCLPITPTLPPGVKSAGVGQPVPAAMSVSTSTNAIPGKLLKPAAATTPQ